MDATSIASMVLRLARDSFMARANWVLLTRRPVIKTNTKAHEAM